MRETGQRELREGERENSHTGSNIEKTYINYGNIRWKLQHLRQVLATDKGPT